MGHARQVVAALLIVGAVAYLILSSTPDAAGLYLTVEELRALGPSEVGRRVTVSGAVVGDTIRYDPAAPRLEFAMAHAPGDPQAVQAAGGQEAALQAAANDPAAARVRVLYENIKPDMLRHEAQAIVRGTLDADGVLQADELLLRCPSRYEEGAPSDAPAAEASGE